MRWPQVSFDSAMSNTTWPVVFEANLSSMFRYSLSTLLKLMLMLSDGRAPPEETE